MTRRPAIVVQPTSHAEVQSVVRYARDRGMPIAVRGGGHDWAGRSLLDDGVVIDMSLMRRVVVDQGASLATLAGGATPPMSWPPRNRLASPPPPARWVRSAWWA